MGRERAGHVRGVFEFYGYAVNKIALTYTVLAAVALASACATQTGMGRATVLEPGQLQWGAAPVAVVHGVKLTTAAPTQAPWVELMGQLRAGVAPDLEVGLRGWAFGLLSLNNVGVAVDGKYQLRRGTLDVASGASLVWQRTSLGGWPWHGSGATVPVHFGWNLGAHQLFGSVRSGLGVVSGESQQTQVFGWGGVGLGFALQLGRWQLVPEVVVSWAPVGFNGAHPDPKRTGASGFEIALGILRNTPSTRGR